MQASKEQQSSHDRPDVIFLPDDKPYLAVLAPPLWLAWHRLWWALLVYMAVISAIMLLLLTSYRDAALFISLLPGIYIWLEGHKLIHQRYELQGWVFQGVVGASSLEDAELRYFSYKQKIPSQMATADETNSDLIKPKFTPLSSTSGSVGIFPAEV